MRQKAEWSVNESTSRTSIPSESGAAVVASVGTDKSEEVRNSVQVEEQDEHQVEFLKQNHETITTHRSLPPVSPLGGPKSPSRLFAMNRQPTTTKVYLDSITRSSLLELEWSVPRLVLSLSQVPCWWSDGWCAPVVPGAPSELVAVERSFFESTFLLHK